MGKKNNVSLKEKYLLWVEYLKRDKELISFLNRIKEKEQNLKIKNFSATTAEAFVKKIYTIFARELFNKDSIKYFHTWEIFRDVLREEKTFDDWWKDCVRDAN